MNAADSTLKHAADWTYDLKRRRFRLSNLAVKSMSLLIL